MINRNTTICSLSTPQGIGAIAVIRVAGPEAFAICQNLFPRRYGFAELARNVAKYAEIYEGEQLIDQVIVVKFSSPHSYTGEDMVEISCHGSYYVRKKILELLMQYGCRAAEPGEFTMRAFLNGKLDLPQAEAVADLIDSQTEAAHKLAVKQLRGNVSNKLEELRQRFIQFAALLELELDFSEEEVEFADREKMRRLLSDIKAEVTGLVRSFKTGNQLKNGIPVAIVGRPNVGKSTLLNALLDEERAIVSDIPGTTRDTIEDTLILDGTLFRFIDTAGIREANNEIERFGIERSLKAIEKADIVVYLFDASRETVDSVAEELGQLENKVDFNDKELLVVGNKIDSAEDAHRPDTLGRHHVTYLSAKNGTNLSLLTSALVALSRTAQTEDRTLLTNARHYGSMLQILDSIELIERGLDTQLPIDLLAIDVRAALNELGNITGAVANDEILNTIFGKFCIGK